MNSATASAKRPRSAPWLAPVLSAAAGAWVFRGALPYFFAQDDFLGLARARGLAPPLIGPWRWLSGSAYFVLMRPFGVSSAAPYHAVNLLAHAAAAALLTLLMARRVSAPAALIGAAYFATHPSLYTALYSVSGIGEVLSGLLAIVTLLLATRGGKERWLALPAFAAALLCKESVLLLPLVLMMSPKRAAGATPESRAPTAIRGREVAWALAATSAGMAVLLAGANTFGVRSGLDPSAPYALSLGPHVLTNAATYLGWAVQPWLAMAHGFQDAVDAPVFPAAAAAVLLWLAGLAWPRLRGSLWWTGGALFALLLAPVLGLRHHTYHYYLYAPLIGVSCCVAALFDAVFAAARRVRESGVAWAIALAATALLTWNGAAFVHTIETHPFTDARLRADALVDRARIARRVADGLASAHLPAGTPVLFWSPWALLEQVRASGGPAPAYESYGEANVRAALMDGLAVRVLFPELGAASFTHRYVAPPPGARVALYDIDGTVRVSTPAQVDSLLRAHPIPGARP